MLVLVSSPVLVPLVFERYVVDIALPCQTPLEIVPSSVISKAFIVACVSSPVLVPLCPLKYVVDIAVPCQVPVPIVPKVVMLVLPANVDIAVFSTLF